MEKLSTTPELDILITEARTTLYALYAKRRQLREAAKVAKPKGGPRRAPIVSLFRSGMSKKDIAQTLGITVDGVHYHIVKCAEGMANDTDPWTSQPWRNKSPWTESDAKDYLDYGNKQAKLAKQFIQNKLTPP